MSKKTGTTVQAEEVAAVEQETVTAPTPKPEAKAAAKSETVVYIGPTVPGVASHNTIYNNGLTEELKEAQKNEPAFKSLVIPVSALAAATRDIANKRGATYAFYEKVRNYKA